MKFEDLESHAKMMKVINQGGSMKNRRGSLPKNISKNSNYTFGVKSSAIRSGLYNPKSPSKNGSDNDSHIKDIIKHTDNIRESLEKKIKLKIEMDQLRKKHAKTVLENIAATKTSELRSQSVLTNMALAELGESLESDKMFAVRRATDTTLADIEKRKFKLERM